LTAIPSKGRPFPTFSLGPLSGFGEVRNKKKTYNKVEKAKLKHKASCNYNFGFRFFKNRIKPNRR